VARPPLANLALGSLQLVMIDSVIIGVEPRTAMPPVLAKPEYQGDDRGQGNKQSPEGTGHWHDRKVYSHSKGMTTGAASAATPVFPQDERSRLYKPRQLFRLRF
jgi:hypothetical protein